MCPPCELGVCSKGVDEFIPRQLVAWPGENLEKIDLLRRTSQQTTRTVTWIRYNFSKCSKKADFLLLLEPAGLNK